MTSSTGGSVHHTSSGQRSVKTEPHRPAKYEDAGFVDIQNLAILLLGGSVVFGCSTIHNGPFEQC